MQQQCINIKDCGLVIDPKTDGVVLEDLMPVGCIEVKCPFTKKDVKLTEAAEDEKSFF